MVALAVVAQWGLPLELLAQVDQPIKATQAEQQATALTAVQVIGALTSSAAVVVVQVLQAEMQLLQLQALVEMARILGHHGQVLHLQA
jgi:hypothetical protein